MTFLPEHYREFDVKRSVYLAGGTVEVGSSVDDSLFARKEKVDSHLEEYFNEDLFQNGSEQNVWASIETKYGPGENGAYRGIITAFVNKIMPGEEDTLIAKDRLIKDSIARYSEVFKREEVEFFGTTHELRERYDDAMEDIKDKTKEELDLLHTAVALDLEIKQGAAKAEGRASELDETIGNLWPHEKWKIKAGFKDYVNALGDYYLNTDWQRANSRPPGEWGDVQVGRKYKESHRPLIEDYQDSADREWGIPIVFPDLDKNEFAEAYEEKAKNFQDKMMDRTSAKLDLLLDNPNTTVEDIKELRKQIEKDYKNFASLDNKGGLIDLRDLLAMETLANHGLDLLAILDNSHVSMDMQLLDTFQFLKPKAFKAAARAAADSLMESAYQNGNEVAFMTSVNELREEEGEEPLDSFRKAKRYFRNAIERRAEAGVTETMSVIDRFNNSINAKQLGFYEAVKPKSLQGMVHTERQRLLSRVTIPESESDRLVVEFMSTDRDGRESILKHRGEELFKAIKNIQKHYSAKYKADAIPDKAGDLRTNRRNLESPTAHDRAARLQAMIMLANESENIISNFSTTEAFEGEDLIERLKATEADKETISLALQFVDTRKSHAVPYASALSRGGFNGRDLAVKGVKVIAAFTVLANVANSIKDADGTDIFEKAADAVANIVTNPAVLAGSAVAAATHAYEMYPQIKNYPFASEYGRKGIVTSIKVDRMFDKYGKENVKALFASPSEWEAMDRLNPNQIKNMLEKSRERTPERPVVTNNDLSGLISDKEVMSGLPEGRKHNHIRYKFYQSFLSGQDKPNINELREICVRF